MTLDGFFIISAMVNSGLTVGGGGTAENVGGGIISFSLIIRPPLLLVFSTCNAVEMPCCWRPKPCPSLKPYLAIIFAATPRPPAVGLLTLIEEVVFSCNDGGGAIATPPPDDEDFFITGSSSSSSPLLIRPANPVAVAFSLNDNFC